MQTREIAEAVADMLTDDIFMMPIEDCTYESFRNLIAPMVYSMQMDEEQLRLRNDADYAKRMGDGVFTISSSDDSMTFDYHPDGYECLLSEDKGAHPKIVIQKDGKSGVSEMLFYFSSGSNEPAARISLS